MNIDDITLGQIKQLKSCLSDSDSEVAHPYEIGENYFIRTVTHHFTGNIFEVFLGEIVLTNAAWVADDGKFSESLADCKFKEVEMFPRNNRVIVGRGGIIDCVRIETLPTETLPTETL